MDFETKLAAAGETLEKLAAERGLSVSDFTEQEVTDLLTTIMGDDSPAAPEADPKVASVAPAQVESESPQLTYGQVMAEVVKVAAQNGYDITQASPAELDDAVQKMAALLSNPEYMAKQAALQEKIAEADAMGRIMAHAYVDELGKLAKVAEDEKKEEKKEEKDEKEEKKASLVRTLLHKTAGEVPEAFKKHEKGESKEEEKKEEEAKKESAFAKAASARAAELLIINGINPQTGAKFASEQEAVDAGAQLILQQKGYL